MPAPAASRTKPRPQTMLPSVALIGCGNWGSALALALHAARVQVEEIVVPRPASNRTARSTARTIGARLSSLENARLSAQVLWICTPDTAIPAVAEALVARLSIVSRHKHPAAVFHSSGAVPASILAPLQSLHIAAASVHPLMTFPRRAARSAILAGVPFALEGHAAALRIARRLVSAVGGEAFSLDATRKPLYHAFGAFASPLLVSMLTAAMETGIAAGLSPAQARRRMQPIVERTLANFFANGPQHSFSGPIARGDTDTVVRHLRALTAHPQLLALYRELARFALTSLPARNAKQIRSALQ